MADLEQQLRELSKERFESFVHQYLVANYPSSGIQRVDGSGGDAGIDSFSGTLASGPTIWQSKHFPTRIKGPQQRQVLKSIKTAFRENTPALWTLCVPINLRTPEHKWFQERIVKVYGGEERIKLLQASDFLTELQHNRNLRNEFFPENAISQILEIRKALTSTETRTQEQLGTLAVEYGQQYLASSMALEPRLQTVVSVGGSPQMRQALLQPGLIMSFSEGEKTTHVFARDPAAFNADPIKLNMEILQKHGPALQEAIDTGKAFALPAGGLLNLSTSSPLLNRFFEKSDSSHLQLELTPTVPDAIASKEVPVRITAGSGNTAQTLYYVPLRFARNGTREFTLVSRTSLPVEITLVLRHAIQEGATVNFRPILPGADVQALDQVIKFLDELERTGQFEVSSIEFNCPLLEQQVGGFTSSITIDASVKKIIADAAFVAHAFRQPLRLPHQISKQDREDLKVLRLIASEEAFSDVMINGGLTKDELYRENFLNGITQDFFSLRMDHPAGSERFKVFGQNIETGPVRFTADHVRFVEVNDLRARYLEAEEGQVVRFKADCIGECRWSRLPLNWNPYASVLIDAGVNLLA